VSVAQRNSGLVFVAYNLMNGFTDAGIDNACHIGSLVGGFGMGWLLARPLESEAREQEWPGVSVALSAAIAALIALSWPLTHPSPEKLAARQFRHDLRPFVDAESRAMKLTTQLDQQRSHGTISDEQWGRRILADVLPLWQEALDDVVTVQVSSQPSIAAVKHALLSHVQSRQLGVELSGEAARDRDKAKTDRARRVLQSSDTKANLAAKLLNANP